MLTTRVMMTLSQSRLSGRPPSESEPSRRVREQLWMMTMAMSLMRVTAMGQMTARGESSEVAEHLQLMKRVTRAMDWMRRREGLVARARHSLVMMSLIA